MNRKPTVFLLFSLCTISIIFGFNYAINFSNAQSDPVLYYSRYLGTTSGEDRILGIAADEQAYSYVTGFMGDAAFASKINPDGTINFTTMLDGNNEDVGTGIAIDDFGACYIAGRTISTDFPTLNAYNDTNSGYYDVFVTKLNSDGSLNYSTYLGGTHFDKAYGIAVGANGTAYVTGHTLSPNFPLLNAWDSVYKAPSDAFITKLNPDGTLNFSTYLGGDYIDKAFGIALDPNGAYYVIGDTDSSDFPLKNEYRANGDGFLTKFNPDNSLNFSTLIASGMVTGSEGIKSVAVDTNGSCYLAGTTGISSFQSITPNAYDNSFNSEQLSSTEAYVLKFTNDGNLEYGSFLGDIGDDEGYGVAVDNKGYFYIVGTTNSDEFPIQGYEIYDISGGGFVTKFNPDGTLNSSAIIKGITRCLCIDIDSRGGCYVGGTTQSYNLPRVPEDGESFNNFWDGFVMKIHPELLKEPEERKIPGYSLWIIFGISIAALSTLSFKIRYRVLNSF